MAEDQKGNLYYILLAKKAAQSSVLLAHKRTYLRYRLTIDLKPNGHGIQKFSSKEHLSID